MLGESCIAIVPFHLLNSNSLRFKSMEYSFLEQSNSTQGSRNKCDVVIKQFSICWCCWLVCCFHEKMIQSTKFDSKLWDGKHTSIWSLQFGPIRSRVTLEFVTIWFDGILNFLHSQQKISWRNFCFTVIHATFPKRNS